jgi:hypothetical protein
MVFVIRDQAKVSPLSREVMLQPLSILFADGLRFFCSPLPAISSAHLAAAYPIGKISGLPSSAKKTEWVRSALSAGGDGVHERAGTIASARHNAFWLKLDSIFSLLEVTTFIERSHMLTIPLILASDPL